MAKKIEEKVTAVAEESQGKQVFVLTWKDPEGVSGITRIYDDEERARQDFDLLQSVESEKTFDLKVMPVYGKEKKAPIVRGPRVAKVAPLKEAEAA